MTATLETKIDDLTEAVDEIREALLGRTAPGSAPGLIQRQNDAEREIAELKRQIKDLAATVKAIEATPGRTALTWWDRVGLLLAGMLLSALGAIVGSALKGHGP